MHLKLKPKLTFQKHRTQCFLMHYFVETTFSPSEFNVKQESIPIKQVGRLYSESGCVSVCTCIALNVVQCTDVEAVCSSAEKKNLSIM